jgi:glycosyltransferase involved in cell wall biosynthesis
MLNLSRGLLSHKVDVDLVLVKRAGEFINDVPDGVRVVPLSARHWSLALPAYSNYLRNTRVDAVISVGESINLLSMAADEVCPSGVPLFVCLQNTLSAHVETYKQPTRAAVRWVLRERLRNTAGVIAVSEGVARDVAQYASLDATKVRVIFNPIITPEMRLASLEKPDHPWLAERSIPVFVNVGRLMPQKDQESLIRGFSLLRRRQRSRLLLLGRGPEHEKLRLLATALGVDADVGFLGFVKNPFSYMRACDAVVLSSVHEGLPSVLIEALACDARIISTDCPSGPREILRGGSLGTLVPMRNPQALADAMERELNSPRIRRLPEAWTRFTVAGIADEYLSFMFGRR